MFKVEGREVRNAKVTRGKGRGTEGTRKVERIKRKTFEIRSSDVYKETQKGRRRRRSKVRERSCMGRS